MRPRLFLRGPVGCGKTTLIREALGEELSRAGGFVTARVLDGRGRRLGFELCPASGGGGRRFLSFEDGRAAMDDEVFTGCAAQLLGQSSRHPFALVDEVGGLEIMLDGFMEAFSIFLREGPPCVGVLKSLDAARGLAARVGLSEEFAARAARLAGQLESDSTVTVLDTAGRGDVAAKAALAAWVGQYVRGEVK